MGISWRGLDGFVTIWCGCLGGRSFVDLGLGCKVRVSCGFFW